GIVIDNYGNTLSINTSQGEIYKTVPTGGYHTGPLPYGLVLNDTTGVISGTPIIEGRVLKTYPVTAYNGENSIINNISLKVTSTEASLTDMKISTGTLTPAFHPDTLNYTALSPNSGSSLAITPTTADVSAAVTVNGTTVKTNEATTAVPLSIGDNSFSVVVTASAGNTKTYTLNVVQVGPPIISYTGPQTYTSGVPISPLVPAHRFVEPPAYKAQTLFATGNTNATGLATNSRGGIYIARGVSGLTRYDAAGSWLGVFGIETNPGGVAVDNQDNIYVTYPNAHRVIKYSPAGNYISDIGSGYSQPYSVAVDAKQNVYVADITLKQVLKTPARTDSTYAVYTGTANYPAFIAADATGNIYMDLGNALYKLPAAGGEPVLIKSVSTGQISGIAVDASDDLYITDRVNKTIQKMPAGRPNDAFVLATTSDAAYGAAVDTKGNVFTANNLNGWIHKITPNGGYYSSLLPPGLRLNDTTGVISGTPKTGFPEKNYEISAYGTQGRGNAQNRQSLQGSVFWMAPEVVKQTGHSSKADIWSVG
ncbi:MAG: hypothetical protein EOP54_22620, partial [Sphingobacteriales bacterium]